MKQLSKSQLQQQAYELAIKAILQAAEIMEITVAKPELVESIAKSALKQMGFDASVIVSINLK